MQILNLTNIKDSDIKYTISRFPDGEVQITLDNINRKDVTKIVCRVTNAEELFLLGQVADILNRQGVRFKLTILYLMSMRMDRVMDFNRPFSLKIVTDFINGLGAISVELLEPHSIRSITELHAGAFSLIPQEPNEPAQRVFPDKGAAEREKVGPDDLVFEKVRDLETGKINSLRLSNPENIKSKAFYVKDDLCDGGGTFVGIAKALKELVPDAKLYISVCHMVNPKGIENLSANYDHVWFSNSYKNWENLPENVTQIDVTEWRNPKK